MRPLAMRRASFSVISSLVRGVSFVWMPCWVDLCYDQSDALYVYLCVVFPKKAKKVLVGARRAIGQNLNLTLKSSVCLLNVIPLSYVTL